jgi:photosystem II protein PsbQ
MKFVIWLNQKILKRAIAISLVSCLISLVLLSSSVLLPNSLAFAANKSKLEIISDRLDQLKPFIDDNNWITIKTYIHGPLGQVRTDIGSAVRLLRDPTKAKAFSNKFFNDLIRLDVAAGKRDIDRTVEAYDQTRQDFNELVVVLKKF